MRQGVEIEERERPEDVPSGGERPRQLRSLSLSNFLSYGPEGVEFTFGSLNVLVGPNGSGKTNLVEALRVMRSSTTGFGAPMITGGGVEAYVYSGKRYAENGATLDLHFHLPSFDKSVRHLVTFESRNGRPSLGDEWIGPEWGPGTHIPDAVLQRTGADEANVVGDWSFKRIAGKITSTRIRKDELRIDESGIEKHRDTSLYPLLASVAEFYESIAIYAEWTIGRDAPPRRSVPAGTRSDVLLEDASNLAFVLSELRATRALPEIKRALRRLKATYEDFSIRPVGGQLQLYVEEEGVVGGINALRLSDGTLRFLALAAVLLHPKPPALVVIDEPEIGMHPDLIDAIAEMILEAAGRTQLIIATHSPELLTSLRRGIDRLYAFGAGAEGTTVRGFDRDQLAAYLAEEPLGELWRQGDFGGNRF